MPEYYEIKVKEQIQSSWTEWFSDLQLTHLDGGETLLSGQLPDQAALHGVLERIRDLNLTLISVYRGGPTLEQSAREKTA